MRGVDVVIPVYDGHAETRTCVDSVLASIDRAWARVVIVNDSSPDARITGYLRARAAEDSAVVLLENRDNLGFVASVNIGMDCDRARDVVLVNSDVEVAGDWLQRLRNAAYRRDDVASVTPFSNSATLCSFPNICEDNRPLFDLPVAVIDACLAADFTADDAFPIPTGVGRCLYLRRDCLDLVGYFDEEPFARGCGEENDWCQRAAQTGRVNLHVANCFVYHRGGISFGGEHSPRLSRTPAIPDGRYPRHHSDIQRFITKDPARPTRVHAWLRLFATQSMPKVLLVSHKLGGGVQQHVDELVQLYAGRALFLLLIPDRDNETVRLFCYNREIRLRDGLFFDISADYMKLVALLRGLGVGRVHFHHTMGLPRRLWAIATDLACGYDLTVHDYYLLNGNPTLSDRDARFVPEDSADFDRRCAGHHPLPVGVDASLWRDQQRKLVEGAARVIFPSRDVRRRFGRFFTVRDAVVAWHPDCACPRPHPAPVWRFPRGRPLRVLVIGALSREKGADVLDQVASVLAGDAIEFHLLGYAYRRLGAQVVTHGPYDNRDVHTLLHSVAPDVIWFPAQWPESYSYTLSVALHNALPVVVPDIGAFAERVRGRAHSAIQPWNNSTADWRAFWHGVLQCRALPAQELPDTGVSPAVGEEFYAEQYLAPVPLRPAQLDPGLLQTLDSNLFANCQKRSGAEWLLSHIWRFSLWPLGSRLVSLVPFRIQRSIKRALSQRPMHDIVGK